MSKLFKEEPRVRLFRKESKGTSLLIILILFIISGCQKQFTASKTKLKVVTTVAPITNIVKNIGGKKIDLYGVIPEGRDSHTFEPKPIVVKKLAEADLIIINGLNLEAPIKKLAQANKSPQAKIVELGPKTISRREWIFDFSFPKEKGDPNPHLWVNIPYAAHYAQIVAEELAKLDPKNKEYYQANNNKYQKLLKELDKRVKQAVATIPPKNRRLLTYHDSWAYFAKTYGFKVIGAVQPADFSEPSPKEVIRLIEQIKNAKLPAIFGSEVYPSKVMKRLKEETGIKFVTILSDDILPGKKGEPQHSYVGMMLNNVKTMVKALGGNSKALSGLNPQDIN